MSSLERLGYKVTTQAPTTGPGDQPLTATG